MITKPSSRRGLTPSRRARRLVVVLVTAVLAVAGQSVRGVIAASPPGVGLWNDEPAPGALTTCGSPPPGAPATWVTDCVGRTAVLIQGPRCRVKQPPPSCGKVLVVGASAQVTTESDANAAEMYDPKTGLWSAVSSMGHLRVGPGAVQIDFPECYTTAPMPARCGQILVVGGNSNEHPDTAEMYDPDADAWSPAGTLNFFHYTWFSTVVLRGPRCGALCGDVLVAAGAGGVDATLQGGARAAEVYNPRDDTNTWTQTGSLVTGRSAHVTALLDGPQCAGGSPPSYCGQVLVAGGDAPKADSPTTRSAELYDPAATDPFTHAQGMWHSTGSLALNGAAPYDPANATATVLSGPRCATQCGQVLVVGGNESPYQATFAFKTAELYDPANRTWSLAPPMQTARHFHIGALLPSGEYLVAGGSDAQGTALSSAELYDPASMAWTAAAPMARARSNFVAMPMAGPAVSCPSISGCTLVVGGPLPSDSIAELYQPGPTITALNPTCGPAAPGTSVTITGTGFTTTPPTTPPLQVKVNGTSVFPNPTPDAQGALHITMPTESGAASVAVTVETNAGISPAAPAATFTYPCPPAPPSPPATGTSGASAPAPGKPPVVAQPLAPLPQPPPAHAAPPALPHPPPPAVAHPQAAVQPVSAPQPAPAAPQAPAAASAPGSPVVGGHPAGASVGAGVGVDGEDAQSLAHRHAMVRRGDWEVSPALGMAGTAMLVVFAGSLAAPRARTRRRRRLAHVAATVEPIEIDTARTWAAPEPREPW